MKKLTGVMLATIVLGVPATSRGTGFDFENAPYRSSLPINLQVGAISARFSATGQGFSVQRADTMGFTPVGFAGLCLYPNSIYSADLLVDFFPALTSFSVLYSPEEFGCDTSAVMRVTAYRKGTMVGSNTAQAEAGTWPTATLAINSAQPFDRVVVHYDKPPSGENWGPIFMVDNMNVTGVPGSWNVDADGKWSEQPKWLQAMPNSVGASAIFGGAISQPRTITVDKPVSVGSMVFHSGKAYQLNGVGPISLVENPGARATICVDNIAGTGDHVIAANLRLLGDVDLANDSSRTLTLQGELNTPAAATLRKTGPGRIVIAGPQSHAPGTVIQAEAGTLELSSDAGGTSGDRNVTLIGAGATIVLGSTQHLHAASIAGGTVQMQPNGQNVIVTDQIALTGTGTLDLADNDLIVRATSETRQGVLDSVTACIKTARGTGVSLWQGPGITSSFAAKPQAMTALGVVLNDKGAGQGLVCTSFCGQPVDVNSILVKYTWNGDANLDGIVNADDYFQIDSGYISQIGGWYNGDFNYDGIVNADDYFLIDSAFIAQSGPLSAERLRPSAVPEPGALGVLLASTSMLMSRRRNR